MPSLNDYAKHIGCHAADLGDVFAEAFFEQRLDTAAIARRTSIPESIVYNALHAWVEQGRPQS